MPAPQPTLLAFQIKNLFRAKALKIPPKWDSKFEDKFNKKIDDFKPAVLNPTALFVCPSSCKLAVDACNTISEKFEGFIDDITSAICQSWSMWHASAVVNNVIINATVGILPPGGLQGMGQMSGAMILAKVKGQRPNYIKHARAIAMAIGQAWMSWESGYTNSTLIFPTGAACVGSMAPAPNAPPVPLASGTSPGDAMMTAGALKAQMLAQFGDKPGEHTAELFDAISHAFTLTFTQWKVTAMISNVIGTGGVAPAPVPGPVIGAIGMMGKVI